ncbi:phage tail protein [Ewingella allii]|uniref:phage tail protein n=1 Tax=Ewingella allii TaxID=3092550 RepID=UPI0037BAD57E
MANKTEKFDYKALKSALLKPTNTAIETTLFGAQVFIRRLTAAELIGHEEQIDAAAKELDVRGSSLISVQLIISCLVNPDGTSIDPSDLPTAAELLEAHDNATLIDAITTVKEHSLGKLEEAQKN